MYHNNIVGMLEIHLCPSHIKQVLRLPGAVSPDRLQNTSDYTDSSRSGRYRELGHLYSTIPAQPKQHV